MAQVKPANKKKMSKNSLIATVVAIVILVAFVVSLVASSGLFVRVQKGAYSENFEINGSMMDYFVAAATNSWYQQVYIPYLASLYGISTDYIQMYLQYGLIQGFDTSKPADKQIFDTTTGQTYADIIEGYASDYITNILRTCEAAKADPESDFAKLEADAKTDAAVTMNNIKVYASLSNMDAIGYIRSNFGPNLNEKDLEKCLVLEGISNAYSNEKYERIYDSTTPERKNEFFKENIDKSYSDSLGSFVNAEILYYNLTQPNTVTFPKAEDYNGAEGKAYKDAKAAYDKLTEEQKKTATEPKVEDYTGGEESKAYKDAYKEAEEKKAKNEAQMIKDQEIMNKLANAKDVDEFKKIILEEKFDANFTTAYNALTFKDESKPTAEALDAYKASVKDKIIAAAIAGRDTVEEKSDVTLDKDESSTTKTDWEKNQATLPDSVLAKLNTLLNGYKQTVPYTTLASNFTQKLFGGVKSSFEIDYESYEPKDLTNATVNTSWFENDHEENKSYYEYLIAMYKDMLDDEDADKESIEKTIENLEKSLKELKEEDLTKTGEYSYTAYIVTKAAYVDEVKTRNVGHILFKVDTTAKETTASSYKTIIEARKAAEELLKKINEKAVDGVVSKEVFEEMAKDTHDSNIFYENVFKGQMTEEFDEWLFAAEKVGTVDIIETTYGVHIIFYDGENDETGWQYRAHTRAAEEDFVEWSDGLDMEVYVNMSLITSALSK